MFWFSTTGWMMWNFLIGCLFTDAAIVLYDGSPAYPDLGVLWELAQRTQMTCMGVSAGLLASCQKQGLKPGADYDLGKLRAIGSTGSPLAPESFQWVYEHVKHDLWLFSTSGGTDVCTAFVGGCPLLPVYLGELQCRALGCAVEAWDEHGHSLIDEVGELVLTLPLPSMPLCFWGDRPAQPAAAKLPQTTGAHAIGERYRESYFSMYPGIWRHGDCALHEVTDALVVDVPRGEEGELWMVLFVVLREHATLDQALRKRIAKAIREDCSPRHVPNEIMQIPDVPRTLSGKLLEVPVKRILMGAAPHEAASIDSLANPAALDYFVALAGKLGES
jgi:acetoacetyl-CoA synthetase